MMIVCALLPLRLCCLCRYSWPFFVKKSYELAMCMIFLTFNLFSDIVLKQLILNLFCDLFVACYVLVIFYILAIVL